MQTPSTRTQTPSEKGSGEPVGLRPGGAPFSNSQSPEQAGRIWRRPPRTPRGARGERPESASEDEPLARDGVGIPNALHSTTQRQAAHPGSSRSGGRVDRTSGKHPKCESSLNFRKTPLIPKPPRLDRPRSDSNPTASPRRGACPTSGTRTGHEVAQARLGWADGASPAVLRLPDVARGLRTRQTSPPSRMTCPASSSDDLPCASCSSSKCYRAASPRPGREDRPPVHVGARSGVAAAEEVEELLDGGARPERAEHERDGFFPSRPIEPRQTVPEGLWKRGTRRWARFSTTRHDLPASSSRLALRLPRLHFLGAGLDRTHASPRRGTCLQCSDRTKTTQRAPTPARAPRASPHLCDLRVPAVTH